MRRSLVVLVPLLALVLASCATEAGEDVTRSVGTTDSTGPRATVACPSDFDEREDLLDPDYRGCQDEQWRLSTTTTEAPEATERETTTTAPPTTTTTAPPTATTAAEDPEVSNARESARSYLDISGFSRQGLIDQLSSEYGDQYPVEAATAAVDSLNVDYNAEAVEAAESYLEFQAFSHAGLVDQLSSEYGDQFTREQAEHGATAALG